MLLWSLVTFGVAVALVIPVLFVQKWLIRKGIVRDGQMLAAAVTVSAVLIRQIWFQSVSCWVMAPFVLLAGIVGANRADLYTTSHRGRWWWMSRPPSE